ncbi:MAG: hypothetical protein QM767_00890 [Anaeromyxobacter sp.]
MNRRPALALPLLLAALAACTSRPTAQRPSGGARRGEGTARALAVSADGAWLAWLDGCVDARVRSLPPGTASCDLEVARVDGTGAPVRVAQQVTTLPGGLAWSPVGATLGVLARHDYATAQGALVRWTPGGGAAELAQGVGFFAFGRDGALGYIAGGELYLDGAAGAVPGTTGASTFELAPATTPGGLRALVRRRSTSGGDLLAVPASGPAVKLAPAVGDYGFSRGGERYAFTRIGAEGAELQLADARAGARPQALARAVSSFAFEPAGPALAFVAGTTPGHQGDLRLAAPGGPVTLLGKAVGEYHWAAAAPRLVWLERYDARVRSGAVGAGGPGIAPRTFGERVSDAEISPDGKAIAFLQHSTRGGYSVDLAVALLDAAPGAAARAVAPDVFGFAFSPDGRWLYYRTRCSGGNAEACDLERIPAAGPVEGQKPEAIAEAARSFEFAAARPERLLLTWARGDGLLEVGVWEAGRLTRVDGGVVPGTARLLPPDARRLAYAVAEKGREGVYVAEVP